MKPSNLKLGDLVYYRDSLVKVVQLGISICTMLGEEIVSDFYNEIKPVPLTSEIINILGYTSTNPDKYIVNDEYILRKTGDCWLLESPGIAFKVKYAHELQHILWVVCKHGKI